MSAACDIITSNLRWLKSITDSVEYLSDRARERTSRLYDEIEGRSIDLGDYIIIRKSELDSLKAETLSLQDDVYYKALELDDVLDDIEDEIGEATASEEQDN